MSGDWRKLRPNARTSPRLELIAVLSVNSPGFMAPAGNRAYVGEGRQTLIASSAFVDLPPSEPEVETKPAPVTKRIAIDQVLATASRATRCGHAAQRVRETRLSLLSAKVAPAVSVSRAERLELAAARARMGRLSLVRDRVQNLDALTAAGRHRRVETPAGAEHYGQPVGSIIITDGPDTPDADKPASNPGDDKAVPLPEGFEKKYKGDDLDAVPRKDMYDITRALCEWNSWSEYEANRTPGTEGLLQGNLGDYDIAAAETDLIRDGINARFLHTGIGPGEEIEIDEDAGEYALMGQLFNDALERHRREEPRSTDPDIFGPRRRLNEMTNSEIAELYADISILTDHDMDSAAMPGLVTDVARRGLNVRAGLDDSAATPEVRAQIRAHLDTIIGQESGF